MAIVFKCLACGADLEAPDNYAGGGARCQTCSTPVRIPKNVPPPSVVNPTPIQAHLVPSDIRVDRPPLQRAGTGRSAKLTAAICIGMAFCAIAVVVKVFISRGGSEKGVAALTTKVNDQTLGEALHTASVSDDHQAEAPPGEKPKTRESKSAGESTKPDIRSLIAMQLEVSEQWDDCFDSPKSGFVRFRLAEGQDLMNKSRALSEMAQILKEGDGELSNLFYDYARAASAQIRALEVMQRALDEDNSSNDQAAEVGAAFDMWEDSQEKVSMWALALRTATAIEDSLPYTGHLMQLERACALRQFQNPNADPVILDCSRYQPLARDVITHRAKIQQRFAEAMKQATGDAQANAIKERVLPVQRKLLILLAEYTPATTEVDKVHSIIISAQELSLESTELLVESLRHADESTLRESLAIGFAAKQKYIEWEEGIVELVRHLEELVRHLEAEKQTP